MDVLRAPKSYGKLLPLLLLRQVQFRAAFRLFDVIFSQNYRYDKIGKSSFLTFIAFSPKLTSDAKREISSEKLSAEQTSAGPADESRGLAVASSHFWKINRSKGNNGWLETAFSGK